MITLRLQHEHAESRVWRSNVQVFSYLTSSRELPKSYNAAFLPTVFVEGTPNPQTLLFALGASYRKVSAAKLLLRLSSVS